MIDADAQAFLEGGRALIVGTVDADGMPRAVRGWGLDVLDATEGRVRLLLPSDDPVTRQNLESTRRLAVTGSSVSTLKSMQGKGHVLSVESATATHRRRAERFRHAFFAEIEQTDRTPRPLLERLVPPDYQVCIAVLDEWYDQTPGPRAGKPVDSDGR